MITRLLRIALLSTLLACVKSESTNKSPPESKELATAAKTESADADGDENAGTDLLGDWKSEYDEMVAALKLSDDEAAKVRQVFAARHEALSKWYSEKGEQLKSTEKKLREAVKSRNLASVKGLTQQGALLREELRKTAQKFEQAIRDALPKQKLAEWDGYLLAAHVIDTMKSLDLTSEQIDRIRARARDVAAASAGEKNPEAAGYLALERDVESQILTAEQKQTYAATKKKNPLRSLTKGNGE